MNNLQIYTEGCGILIDNKVPKLTLTLLEPKLISFCRQPKTTFTKIFWRESLIMFQTCSNQFLIYGRTQLIKLYMAGNIFIKHDIKVVLCTIFMPPFEEEGVYIVLLMSVGLSLDQMVSADYLKYHLRQSSYFTCRLVMTSRWPPIDPRSKVKVRGHMCHLTFLVIKIWAVNLWLLYISEDCHNII